MATLSVMRKEVQEALGHAHWQEVIQGFHKRKAVGEAGTVAAPYYTKLGDVFQDVTATIDRDPKHIAAFLKKQAIIDYIDSSETENTLICINPHEFLGPGTGADRKPPYTHCEIHESLLLGVMGNQVTYPEMNPFPRDLFSCGQSKQACSLYHTNYQMRMDKTAVVLHYGQVPMVKTRYMDMINREENPYGFNAIVAIACYSGYNVEDAILINEGAIQRGMFRTTYYTTYSAHEEKGNAEESRTEVPIDMLFANIEELIREGAIVGMKPGYDYSHLDSNGLIREGTPIEDKTMLIGLTATSGSLATKHLRSDASVGTKKGQLGYVDRVYLTEGEEGERIAKVRVREERIPTLGDKFAGRAGQKGTIGMVIPERDMPYTKDGVRPDIIINPHAIPSRMTIGQLVESVTGKACAIYGGYADCTAFGQKGQKVEYFGELLQRAMEDEGEGGFESYGNEVLYNGMTGEQIETSIFIGNVYYMRLKHMVKDKQQSRCLGPRSALTKQPVGGRANDGGLRIGEMERDSLMAHGVAGFLKESTMERSDKYYMAICNKSGMMAIYNPTKNLFISPMVDGPLRFTGDNKRDIEQMRVDVMTRFGRDFSIIEVPYTMKLMMQELATAGIHMRIITDDNIDQFDSMSYSTIRKPEEFRAYRVGEIIKAIRKETGDNKDGVLNEAIRNSMKGVGDPKELAYYKMGGGDDQEDAPAPDPDQDQEIKTRDKETDELSASEKERQKRIEESATYSNGDIVMLESGNQVYEITNVHQTAEGKHIYTLLAQGQVGPDLKESERIQVVTTDKIKGKVTKIGSAAEDGGGMFGVMGDLVMGQAAAAGSVLLQDPNMPKLGIQSAGGGIGPVNPIGENQIGIMGQPGGAVPQGAMMPAGMMGGAAMVPMVPMMPMYGGMGMGMMPMAAAAAPAMPMGPIGMMPNGIDGQPQRGGFTKIRFGGDDGKLRMKHRSNTDSGSSGGGNDGLLVKAAKAVENTVGQVFKVVKNTMAPSDKA
jgi:hypothetical protein